MPLSYPYKQNDEDEEIPVLKFVEDTITTFEQLPSEEKEDNANVSQESLQDGK